MKLSKQTVAKKSSRLNQRSFKELSKDEQKQICDKLVLKYSMDYSGCGISFDKLVTEGKKEAQKVLSMFLPQRNFSFSLYLGWRLKSRYYRLIHSVY